MTTLERSAPFLAVRLRTTQGDLRVVSDDILSWKYKDRERKTDHLTLEVNNEDLGNFDDPVWRKGGELLVRWGYPGAATPERSCIITSVKGFNTLTIEAEDKSVLMNRVVKSRGWASKKVSDIVREIAKENGFGDDQLHIDDSAKVHVHVNQAKLTDAQFVRRWAAKLGFEFYVDFDGFHFHPRRLDAAPCRVFTYYVDQAGGDIIGTPTIENDLTARPGKVNVVGRDPKNKRDIKEAADNKSDKDRPVLTELVEMIDKDTGDAQTIERRLGSEDTVKTSAADADEARKQAQARYRRAQQVAVKMKFRIIGDPLMLAKTVIQMAGMGQRLSIRYYVTEVEHDGGGGKGYECEVSCVSDGHGGHSTKSKAVKGLELISGKSSGAGTKGKGVSQQVLNLLRQGVTVANTSGDKTSAGLFDKNAKLYAQNGNRASAGITADMKGIVSAFKGGTAQRQAADIAAQVVAALAQQGGEAGTGGRLNEKDPLLDPNALEAVQRIDGDTGAVLTGYQQTPARGTGSRN